MFKLFYLFIYIRYSYNRLTNSKPGNTYYKLKESQAFEEKNFVF